MPRPATDKRERLTAAAIELTYHRGFDATSLADIATEAGISAGSVYYYFKTKDDVGAAIVGALIQNYEDLFAKTASLPDPRDRLLELVNSYTRDAKRVSEWGCPVGAVTAELSKQSEELAREAGAVLERPVTWATAQFVELGYARGAARARAIHLVAVLQGAASLACALGSPDVVVQEADHLTKWIRRSPNS